MTAPASEPLTLPRRMKLSGRAQFGVVFAAATRIAAGPLLIYSNPNDLNHPRIGLSVPRSVGNAVKRNRIKRMLREAFRHMQHNWPRGYDVVICARPHKPLTLADYQQTLAKAAASIHATWTKRQANP